MRSPSNEERVAVQHFWPQPLRISWIILLALLGALIPFTSEMIFRGILEGESGVVSGSLGALAILISGLIGTTGKVAAHRNLSPRIREATAQAQGRGVVVPSVTLRHAWLIFMLAGAAVYGLAASLLWHVVGNDTLIANSRDPDVGATVLGILGAGAVVMLVLLTPFLSWSQVILIPEGIRRIHRPRVPIFSKGYDTSIPWDSIDRVEPDVMSRGYSRNMPIINLHHNLEISDRPHYDGDGRLTLLLNDLVAEPNTLLALIEDVHANPERRHLLATPEARLLLTPPPLRERWAAAKRLKREAGEAERSST
ncbi:hypothetical protein G4H71_13480 [Rhodococcus triatomae]|uniref:Uncharacterized protein n=1 Tax=Rhodococcus triatomae TaxID=300028 RepID=A0A1G8T1L4_9NOCA|nr:hypothetical protein [Rhodococcus triatomae]QNG20184.1 hypothetical protein G4H72_16895 [Rhodococcus triatomae]QNG23900.1 hypothetical protein G4H71_13480 [Rhodococcus triatomae]SDJ35418.1 hypothetical protein SAMN05444695_1331 [Rhodococcus triatomae]